MKDIEPSIKNLILNVEIPFKNLLEACKHISRSRQSMVINNELVNVYTARKVIKAHK